VVDLFGKKRLEDRVAELEFRLDELERDKDDLLRTLEKREEKIRKLSHAYQEANLALKAAEQRTVVPTPPSLKSDKPDEARPLGEKLAPREVERLLKKLESSSSPYEDLLTAYLPNAENPPHELPSGAQKLITSIESGRGGLVLHNPQLFGLFLVPPFPLQDRTLSLGSRFQLGAVKEMMETPVLVISAHAGDTLLGMALGSGSFEELEVIKSQVKEKHSKGGFSQKRFERLREEDIKNHLDAVLLRWSALEKKYSSVARYVVLGGDPALLKQISLAIGLPAVERRLERYDEKRPEQVLEDVYSFSCYRF
jgi:hypothetical protein